LDTGFTDIPKIISEEDVDILPYIDWTEEKLMTGDFAVLDLFGITPPVLPPPPPPAAALDLSAITAPMPSGHHALAYHL
ncbi:hypothetical protein M9458_019801, partial [Cirrhinus mrigala]